MYCFTVILELNDSGGDMTLTNSEMEAKLSALEDRIVFLSEQLERLEDYIEKEVYHKWQLEKSQGSSGYAKSS